MSYRVVANTSEAWKSDLVGGEDDEPAKNMLEQEKELPSKPICKLHGVPEDI